MYCLGVFIVVLQELYTKFRLGTSPSFVCLYLLVSEIAKCIAGGCLLLFYKDYIVYYKLYLDIYGLFIEKHMYTKFHLDLLLYQCAHLCPHNNAWPEVVY